VTFGTLMGELIERGVYNSEQISKAMEESKLEGFLLAVEVALNIGGGYNVPQEEEGKVLAAISDHENPLKARQSAAIKA
jgi:hypothetical protein